MDLNYYETKYTKQGYRLICGLDEAGRGPLAGPLVVAGVIMPNGYHHSQINDSKKISAKQREQLYDVIIRDALAYQIEIVPEVVIDQLNIYQATKQAMIKINQILQPDYTLTDAMPLTEDIPHLSIIKGDSKSISIAAASILAKVTRDRLMQKLDLQYPNYGFAKHKGYGTKAHLNALFEYGPSPIHRKTYQPVKSMLKKDF